MNSSASNSVHWLGSELVVASGNQGKVAEFARLLADLPLTLRTQAEFDVTPAEETGLTFVENAILKARAVALQTGLPALADDSGLEVDSLNGAPGVRSARYAPEGGDKANRSRLLSALDAAPDDQRNARFHCVIVLLRHAEDPTPLIARGSWEGSILRAEQGDRGFGYDPLFYVPTHDCSAAELDADEKNRISHRGLAVAELLTLLTAH